MNPESFFEISVPEGLEAVAYDELRARLGGQERLLHPLTQHPGVLQFAYSGRRAKLLQLKCALSLFQARWFDVPRPRALMGQQNFQAIFGMIEETIGLMPRGSYHTLHLAAAGSDTSVMSRFAAEIAARFGLEVVQGEGDLLVRVRRPLDAAELRSVDAGAASRPSSPLDAGLAPAELRSVDAGGAAGRPSSPLDAGGTAGRPSSPLDAGGTAGRPMAPLDAGWEVLARMSNRPLSARKWRVCDYEGALNAAVAHASALLSRPRPEDVFLNLGCGSGTLLIERASAAPSRRLIGCDVSAEALRCARENIAASGFGARIQVVPWDARALPLEDSSVDVICADLPFGLDVGSHQENEALYPALLRESARVAKPGARGILITQEVRLLAALLEESKEWKVEEVAPILINGLRPRIFRVKRVTA